MRNGYVYIMTNRRNHVLYIGVTSDLMKRVSQHKLGTFEGFTKKHRVHKLVYYEVFPEMRYAIEAEKTLKAGSRGKKESLINVMNPAWRDLSEDWMSEMFEIPKEIESQ